jgi:hypothetical protein
MGCRALGPTPPALKRVIKAKDLLRRSGVGTRLDSAFRFTRLEPATANNRAAANMEG